MNDINDIKQELENMDSPLASAQRDMPYHVPAGYFEQMAVSVAIKAAQHENDVPDFGNTLPYAAPVGYFEALPSKVLQLIKEEDTRNLKNVSVSKKQFAFLPGIRWAAAAALAIIIGTGGYMMFTSQNNSTGAEQMLASIPRAEINAYVQHRYGIDATKMQSSVTINNLDVDSKDIVAYLDETGWE